MLANTISIPVPHKAKVPTWLSRTEFDYKRLLSRGLKDIKIKIFMKRVAE